MKRTTYQVPEIRDENDNIIQDGTFGKHSAFSNATNDGAFDYILNNLEALRDNINGSRIYVKNKDALTTPGDISAMYIAEDTGKWYLWDGNKYIETDNARKIADEAIAARDAAKASQTAAKTSEQNAKTSETNAAASAKAAATSAGAAKTSEQNAGTQAKTAKAWATSTTSPDGAADTSSTTGETQSAKSWAMYSKDRATASASSASAASTSAGNAKTSETNAASSKTAAATSATNAANSAKAAADSATAAANSTREQQADWAVTDSTSKAFIKNKPDVLLKSGGTVTGTITATKFSGPLTGNVTGTADKAVADGDGNNIVNTYVTKSAVQGELTNYLPLSGGTLTGVVNGVTPTAGDNSTKIATTEFVNAKAGNYLPLSGGTLTGVVNGVTPPNGDNSKKLATTAFVNAKAAKYLPLSGGTMSGWLSANENEFRIRNSKAEHDGAVSVFGGDGATTGANLYLYGTSHSSQAGRFVLSATDGANKKSLLGQADGTLTWNSQPLLPVVGIVQAFAGTTIPNGWLLCDGSAVSRTDYAALYAVIGTTYGAGNGSTTFNLPNLVDKFVEGSTTAGTVKSAGLPNITGSYVLELYNPRNVPQGAYNITPSPNTERSNNIGSTMGWATVNFDASRSNSIYGKSTTVQPPALTMRYIIKY